jgi:hypothetical protein
MWETPDGFRTLNGPEAVLVHLGVAALLIELDEVAKEGTRLERCVPIFDEFTWQQQWALLARVTHALLRPDIDAPARCAIDDAMVAIIFRQIEAELAHEIDFTNRNVIRRQVLVCVNLRALVAEHTFNRNSTNVDD